MSSAFVSPLRYVQGPNAFYDIGKDCVHFGKKAMIVGGKSALEASSKAICNSLSKEGIAFNVEPIGYPCTQFEAERLFGLFQSTKSDFIIGIGGGSVMDTSKYVALGLARCPCVVCPTVASTDAPTSALSVIYTDAGVVERVEFFNRNPDLVVVDSKVIAMAPVRFLVSGMGDALATAIEANSVSLTRTTTCAGGIPTQAALALANRCYEIIINHGVEAKLAVTSHCVTPDLEKVIEANILLSGLGFENGGLSAAHAIHNGLTKLKEMKRAHHGEKVGFGILAQLVLQGSGREKVHEVLKFFKSVGLPMTLFQLGLREKPGHGVTGEVQERLAIVAKRACEAGDSIHQMPFLVTPDAVYSALVAADAIGHQYRTDHEL